MSDDERILDLQIQISNLTTVINCINKEEMPDLRDFEDADVSDLEKLNDQLEEVYETMNYIRNRYIEEE